MPGPVPKIAWTPSRKQFTATIGGKLRHLGQDKAEAERQFKFLMTKHELAEPATNAVTFGEVADAWLDFVQKHHAADRYRNCKAKVNEFLAHLGRDIKVKDLRPHHVEDWIASKPGIKAAGSKRLYKAMILAVLNWGASHKVRMIASNPLKGRIELPEGKSRGGDAVWPPGLFQQVVENTNDRFADLLKALAWTGARPSTIQKVEARHYRPALRLWDVEDLYKGRTSKRKYVKRIWLPAEMIPIVERLNKEHPTGPIFRNTLGRPYSGDVTTYLFFQLRTRLKKRGIEVPDGVTMYGLRHTFATRFIVQHPDKLEYLREILGHADLTMIRKNYSHLFDESKAINNVLDDFKPL